jgi:hypothetical protein
MKPSKYDASGSLENYGAKRKESSDDLSSYSEGEKQKDFLEMADLQR